MADLALRTANAARPGTLTVVQHTVPAGEAITAMAPCYFDSTTGKAYNSDANAAGKARVWGVALRTARAGESVTLVRQGLVTGLNVDALGPGAPLFLSDTVGRIADAAPTNSVYIGHVFPIFGEELGSNPAREVMVELAGSNPASLI